MSDFIHVRGEGGAVIKMTLPLHKSIQQRLDRGDIVRVSEDGEPLAAEPAPDKPAARGKTTAAK